MGRRGKNELYAIERILKKRVIAGKVEYLIKWQGYPVSKATWESDNVASLNLLIEEFERDGATNKRKPPAATATPVSDAASGAVPAKRGRGRQPNPGQLLPATQPVLQPQPPAQPGQQPQPPVQQLQPDPPAQSVQQLEPQPPAQPVQQLQPPVVPREREASVEFIAEIPSRFPSMTLELAVKKEQLAFGQSAGFVTKFIDRVPFEMGITVLRAATTGEESLGLIVRCNNRIRSSKMWTVGTTMKVSINNAEYFELRPCTFSKGATACIKRLLPWSLEAVLKENSKYVNKKGEVPLKVTVVVVKTEGFAHAWSFDIQQPHELADAILDVQGTLLYVDSAFLSLRSRFFFQAYKGVDAEKNKKMLHIDVCTATEFTDLLEYLYMDYCPMTPDNCVSMSRLSRHFGMDNLWPKFLAFFKYCLGSLPVESMMQAMLWTEEGKISELYDIILKYFRENKRVMAAVMESHVYKHQLSVQYKLRLLETVEHA